MALTNQTRGAYRWQVWGDGAILLAAAPFLLFPTVSDVGTVLALLLVAASWLIPALFKRRPLLPFTPFNSVFLLWGLMLMVGMGVTADPELTLPKATGLIFGFALWRYLVWTVQDERRLAWGVVGFGLLGIGFVFLGALAVDWAGRVKLPILAEVVSRIPTVFIRIPESAAAGVAANQLAGTLLIHFMLLVSAVIGWRPQRWSRAAGIVVLILAAMTAGLLVLTQSRSGWIGGFGGLLALLLMWGMVLPRSKKRLTIWLVLLSFVGLGLLGLVQIGPERIQNLWEEPAQETVIGNLGTVSFRKEVWQWAIAGIGDFPFTGMGLGSFRQVVKRLYPINVAPDYDIAHAHNIFLQVALDLGLPGLIAYLALLMVAAIVGWQVARQNERLRPMALGLIAGLAALHIYDLTDALALGSKPGIIFWAALGLLAAMHQITNGVEGGKIVI